MPYTATTWVNGTTALNATHLQNLESQYTESSLSFEPDQFTAGFVISGYAATGSVGTTTVNVAAGTAYLLQADSTTRQRKLTSSTQTTSTPSTTYHLYLQPDGTWYWSTSNAPASNSLHIADVATNGSGQISTITDFRPLNPVLFPGLSSYLQLPVGIMIGSNAGLSGTPANQAAMYVSPASSNLIIVAPLNGSAGGIGFAVWDSAARQFPFSVGGQIGSAKTYLAVGGSFGAVAGQATAGSFGVPVVVAQVVNTHVTGTGTTNVLSFAPAATGIYRVNASFLPNGTNPSTITIAVNYHDPNVGGSPSVPFTANQHDIDTVKVIKAVSITTPTFINCFPQVIYADTGAHIDINYTNAGGTPSDWVSAFIERIS